MLRLELDCYRDFYPCVLLSLGNFKAFIEHRLRAFHSETLTQLTALFVPNPENLNYVVIFSLTWVLI